MTRFLRRGLGLLSLGLLMTVEMCRAQAPNTSLPSPLLDRRYWYVNAYLFPTTKPGIYDLCLEPYSTQLLTATPRLSEMRAEVRNQGTLRTLTARVVPLPAPLPIASFGPMSRFSGRSWFGLRWDPSGLPPGLYMLTVTLPVDAVDSAGQPFPLPLETVSLPVYLPDPRGLLAARAKYLGKRVWPQAGLQPVGSDTTVFQMSERTSLRVRSITRRTQPFADLSINGGYGPGWDMTPADFVTHNPLRVIFDRPRHLQVTGFALVGRKPATAQGLFFQDFADPWQLDRALHFRPPPRHLPLLKPGLTPEQILLLFGWPTEYGSLVQLKQRSTWRYDTIRPHYATVYFSHGKFVRYDPGGHLP